ncbi:MULTISPECIES: DUF1707 SHOCT-like domain-containing protein [Amycolatopsis]|uniref:DUF1707 domain-containing protein n=2 Tax=Amycolatopsis TaxID=1813 RepID=A0A1I3NP27_9PSEU|nr:DUF1707 domain-containing protein [Amycolatopsis sacchari]SFJ10907.1 protein of unknown function [Amycolatopsis sacchari]
MTTPTRIRASDADRERVARRIQRASGEGRLPLDETERRLGTVYAATYVDELAALLSDLPPEPAPRFPLPLQVHAAVAVVLAVLLVTVWAVSGAPFFWPVAPLFWLSLSLVAHAAFRWRAVPY